MTGKRELKREDLKARLIEAARIRIAESGLASLRARDVTQDAGCALGGLYTAFRDLDELVLHVNSATLAMLEGELVRELAGEADPARQLRILAHGYLNFALGQRNLWAALFEHKLPEGAEVPDWHLEKHLFLIQFIARPLAVLNPQMEGEDLRIRALTLFSAVHGIISISLEGRFVGLPRGRLESELDDFVSLLAAGSTAARQ
ncbi:MAG: WHG domain-containing protein [Rhizobium sp.]|nr:WHG domain-containing protein [Rhizobium sp.]